MKINKEGYRVITFALLIKLVVAISIALLCPAWIAWIVGVALFLNFLFILSFFREPKRPIEQNKDVVYCPADGTVVVVERVNEGEYLNEERVQVSIFMSITNVHVNWFPVAGEVEFFKHHEGKFLVAWHPKSSEENERTTTVINTGREKILFRQIAGMVARRIVSYAKVGARVEQNQKCGFIKFGSRIDLFLPLDAEILVGIDDKVVGSQTVIARFNREA